MKRTRLARPILRKLLGAEHADDALGDLEERYGRVAARHGERRARRVYRREVRDLVIRLIAARIVDRGMVPWGSTGSGRVNRNTGPGSRQRVAFWSTVAYDLRIALRAMRTTPVFAVAVVLTLTFGIGANTAIFSAVSALLFRPLGYPDEHRLTVLSFDHPERGLEGWQTSYQTFLDLRDQATSFDLAGFSLTSYNVRGRESAERIGVARVSAGFWNVVGVTPVLGRSFTSTEDQPGGPPLVVLSHELWARQFGGDSTVLGTPVHLNGLSYTVIGVMPRGFRLLDLIKHDRGSAAPERIDAFVHLASFGRTLSRRARTVMPLARILGNADVDNVRAEVETVHAGIAQAFPVEQGWVPRVETLREQLIEDVRPALLMAWSAAALILILACVNISSLVLVRGTRRRGELAIRLVLGGSRARIARQLLIEATILGLLGGVLGGLASFGILQGLSAVGPIDSLAVFHQEFNPYAAVFALALAILTSVGIGLVPAISLTSRDPAEALRQTGQRTSIGTTALRAFMVTEVALALTLLTSAALLTRSFARLVDQNVGHRTDSILTFAINLSEADYPEDADATRFVHSLEREVAGISGVELVSAVSFFPPQGPTINFTIAGHSPGPDDQPTVERQAAVTPGFFEALDIPLLSGRMFIEADDADAANVVIISEAFAKRHYGEVDPIGTMLAVGSWRHVLRGGSKTDADARRVVGVVGDVREVGIDGVSHVPMLYQPHAQDPWPTMTVIVRTAAAPAGIMSSVRIAAARLDRGQPLYDVQTMASVRDEGVARERFLAGLVSGFALLALLLAAFGIYSVIAYTVTLRTQEIGIRLALGARPAIILRQLMRAGGVAVGLGLVLGVLASAASARLLTTLLFQVSAGGIVTPVAMAALLAVVASMAVYLPARRVAALDAAHCLRVD